MLFILKVSYLCVVISVTVGQNLNINFSDDDKILEEGDACLISNIVQGKCVLASKCLERVNLRPKVCSFSGDEAVICCKSSERISEKSMCAFLFPKFYFYQWLNVWYFYRV